MVFEHGIGGSQDLPIPLSLALAGGAAALAISFIVLAIAWRNPRYDASVDGRPLPERLARAVDGGWLSVLLRVVGLVFTAYVVWAAVAGADSLANPTFGVVYVWLWVGIVPASLLVGPVYKALNPLRTLHWLMSRLTGGDPGEGIFELPRWVGRWPGAFGLFAFTWMELVWPDSTFLWAVRLWFAAYGAIVLVGAALFGDRWIAAADPFEVFSTLMANLSIFGRTADGTLVTRTPLRNLDGVKPGPGLLAVVATLVGSTMFDSFQDSLAWVRLSARISIPEVPLNTLAMLAFCLAVGVSFAVAVALTPVPGVSRRVTPSLFAHSVVPIVAGYFIAHYLSYLAEVGQQTLIYLSDPMVDGSNYLGTANLQMSYWLSVHPTLLALLKVGAIIVGHILGVISAHDRAVRLLPRRDQLTGQLPLLIVMVGYTLSGLYLLLTV